MTRAIDHYKFNSFRLGIPGIGGGTFHALSQPSLLGFGEVGQALADDLGKLTGIDLTAFDILFGDNSSVPSLGLKKLPMVKQCGTAIEAADNCGLVISAVTAAEAVNAARSVSGNLSAGTYFLDLNSVSPATTKELAEIIGSTGAHFVEAAVMSPIKPKGIVSPILLGGSNANGFLKAASKLGLTGTTVFSDQIGLASATKMCRSVIIKGLEALLAESLLAARHYGVEADVVKSLNDLLQVDDWRSHARYMISRSVEHGSRRAEEMREAAVTVHDAGIDPLMSTATAKRQEWASNFSTALNYRDLSNFLDSILTDRDKTKQRQTA